MGRTIAALAFIGVVAGVALFLAQKRTVMKGSVMAADMVEQLKDKGHTGVTVSCDEDVPIGVSGAMFECRFAADDGSTATYRYLLNREGKLSGDLLGSTAPNRRSSDGD